ncbi:non-specific lipid transfer protein GPI-anchored 11-like [Corylus avellana]|uniref:non-specific lipid transfer protein GPI-anchored 11-like n=1 Tax=Corylus avellana TaxID=13451 RepID=UPI00286C3660|nr:non-specific lipid transfer protein GPI-anchored 11-like [Corylus avellana]
MSSSSPASDCNSLTYDIVDCAPFLLSDESEKTMPDNSCCSGFETVLKTNTKCICEAMKSSAHQFGIHLNMKQMMALPSACGLATDSPLSHCDISVLNDHEAAALAYNPPPPKPAPKIALQKAFPPNSDLQELSPKSALQELSPKSSLQELSPKSSLQELSQESYLQELSPKSSLQELSPKSALQEMSPTSTSAWPKPSPPSSKVQASASSNKTGAESVLLISILVASFSCIVI